MDRLDTLDTIAAIASPPGRSVRGLVRLSGPASFAIAAAFDPEPMFGDCRGPMRSDSSLQLGTFAFPVSIARWPGPRTYTGQPMVELGVHGAAPILRRTLDACLDLGARLAGPGEFTLRAFLSGRIDLTRAEAVLGLIHAENPAQVEGALRQHAGGIAGPVTRLRDELLDALALLEAYLDFSEEPDVDPLGRRRLAAMLGDASMMLAELSGSHAARDRREQDPRVVLIGPTNAGKSRLFNALVGSDRAIVSDADGTTRDYLAERCRIDDQVIELIDTAGFEAAIGPIEESAQALRDDRADAADLLLDCRSDDTAHLSDPGINDCPRLHVWTKADRGTSLAPAGAILTSAAIGHGLVELRSAIVTALRDRLIEGNANASISARCRAGIARAVEALDRAAEAIKADLGDELIALDLREAVEDLGRVIGAEVDDAILDRIFRRFCIGK